jgi:hypothetical protein
MTPGARCLLHRLILAGAGTLALCASAAAQIDIPNKAPPAGQTAPAAKPGALPIVEGDAALPALDDLSETRERPLFSSTRRPPEVEPTAQTAAPIAEGASMPFELVGIALGTDVSAAIFRNTDSKEETRVAKGGKIGNWSVEDISERAVVLRGSDKRVRMRLFNEASAPGIKVSRVGGEDDAADAPADEDDSKVDEDISPTSSPQVRPATAQPKPPPSLRENNQRRSRRPGRPNQRPRRQP